MKEVNKEEALQKQKEAQKKMEAKLQAAKEARLKELKAVTAVAEIGEDVGNTRSRRESELAKKLSLRRAGTTHQNAPRSSFADARKT